MEIVNGETAVRIEPRPTEEGRKWSAERPTKPNPKSRKATDVWTKINGTDDEVFDWEGWVRR